MIFGGHLGQRASSSSRAKNNKMNKQKIGNKVTFLDDNFNGIKYLHDDPIIVSLNITNYDVHQVLVDNESSVDVIFYDTFVRMNLDSELLMKRIILLIGFLGTTVRVERTISLATIIGHAPNKQLYK